MSMRTYSNALNTHVTPQSRPIPGREAELVGFDSQVPAVISDFARKG